MLRKADYSAPIVVVAALALFFIGGLLTTVVPPIVVKTWSEPFHKSYPGKRVADT